MFTLFPFIGREDPGWRFVLDAFVVGGGEPAFVALPESAADLDELRHMARTRGLRLARRGEDAAGAILVA